MLVLDVDELLPRLLRLPADQPVEMRVELQVVGVQVAEELLRAQDLDDLHELVVVVVACADTRDVRGLRATTIDTAQRPWKNGSRRKIMPANMHPNDHMSSA